MKALILVGGYGTRLRPLTLTQPKPLVEFCNKPIIFYQIEALIDVGVDTIILAVSYMSEVLEEKINKFVKDKKVSVIFSKESEPLGTGGPIALAREYLSGTHPFFVLNSDITCTYPLKQMICYHKTKGAEGSILVTKVDEPSKYGVILSDSEGKVLRFVEKPATFISNKINAGIYLLNPSVLDRIEVKPTSIEKEVFPAIASDQGLYSYDLEGFWMDIGQPKDYLLGSKLYLNHLEKNFPQKLGNTYGQHMRGLIHSTAVIGTGCHVGVGVVIGENVVIGDGVCLTGCVILSGSVIKSYSSIDKSLIGWRCTIGKWVRIQNYSVLGEDVNVKDEVFINGSRILPHKCISASLFTSEIVM